MSKDEPCLAMALQLISRSVTETRNMDKELLPAENSRARDRKEADPAVCKYIYLTKH
jgi:hypothetical protein